MRTFVGILFVIVLVFQATVMAGKKEHQHDDNNDDATVCEQKIEKCNSDIVDIVDKLKVFNEDLSNFKVTDGFLAAYGLHNAVKDVEELIYKASYDCCAIPRELTEEETNDILDEKDPLFEQFEHIFKTLLGIKSSGLKNIFLPSTILRNSLRNIQALIQPLTTCLADKAHDDQKADVQHAAAELDILFSKAIKAI